MVNTLLYDLQQLESGAAQPHTVLQELFNGQEKALNSSRAWTITTDTSPTKLQMSEGFIHVLGGTPAADFALNIPASSRTFKVRNNTLKVCTVQVTGAAGKRIIIPDGNEAVLQCDGADVSYLSSWAVTHKKADQQKTSDSTLADDLHLKFRMEVSTIYRVRGMIFFDTAATPDFKFSFVGPASPTLVRFSRLQCIAGGTPAEIIIDQAYPAAVTLVGTGTNGGYISFEGLIQNGVNAGNFAFQWAQNTSDAGATIVRGGSFLEHQKIG